MVTLVRPVQPQKAHPPITVTSAGMVTLVRPVQPEKTSHLITVTPSGMVTSPPGPLYSCKTPFLNDKILISDHNAGSFIGCICPGNTAPKEVLPSYHIRNAKTICNQHSCTIFYKVVHYI